MANQLSDVPFPRGFQGNGCNIDRPWIGAYDNTATWQQGPVNKDACAKGRGFHPERSGSMPLSSYWMDTTTCFPFLIICQCICPFIGSKIDLIIVLKSFPCSNDEWLHLLGTTCQDPAMVFAVVHCQNRSGRRRSAPEQLVYNGLLIQISNRFPPRLLNQSVQWSSQCQTPGTTDEWISRAHFRPQFMFLSRFTLDVSRIFSRSYPILPIKLPIFPAASRFTGYFPVSPSLPPVRRHADGEEPHASGLPEGRHAGGDGVSTLRPLRLLPGAAGNGRFSSGNGEISLWNDGSLGEGLGEKERGWKWWANDERNWCLISFSYQNVEWRELPIKKHQKTSGFTAGHRPGALLAGLHQGPKHVLHRSQPGSLEKDVVVERCGGREA